MLVISRKIDQTIVIGGNITMTVLEVDRGNIRLGFDAPDDVHILRKELVGTEYTFPTPEGKIGRLVLPEFPIFTRLVAIEAIFM